MNKISIIIFTAFLVITALMLYDKFSALTLIVKFDDLEPFEKQMNVYYKGFKIGKTVNIYPDKNYINTYLKIKIKPRNIKLPNNIYAVIKTTPSKQYVNIMYPSSPSLIRIKNGEFITGKVAKDVKTLFNESFEEEGIDEIIDDAAGLIESANSAVQNLNKIFINTNKILLDIQSDIELTANKLEKTAANLENLTSNLNIAMDKDTVKNSAANIEETTQNIKNITSNLNDITVKIDEETVPALNSVICETNATIENTQEITSGIKTTLKKRMGLMHLMFGKPVNNKCN